MRMSTAVAVVALAGVAAIAAAEGGADRGFETGTPEIRSMSALAFGADGVLLVGDGKTGAVFAIDVADTQRREGNDAVRIEGVEEKIASLLGTRPDDVMIHDLAVNPVSRGIYISVSRARSKWDSSWLLPNDGMSLLSGRRGSGSLSGKRRNSSGNLRLFTKRETAGLGQHAGRGPRSDDASGCPTRMEGAPRQRPPFPCGYEHHTRASVGTRLSDRWTGAGFDQSGSTRRWKPANTTYRSIE